MVLLNSTTDKLGKKSSLEIVMYNALTGKNHISLFRRKPAYLHTALILGVMLPGVQPVSAQRAFLALEELSSRPGVALRICRRSRCRSPASTARRFRRWASPMPPSNYPADSQPDQYSPIPAATTVC